MPDHLRESLTLAVTTTMSLWTTMGHWFELAACNATVYDPTVKYISSSSFAYVPIDWLSLTSFEYARP